MVLKLIRRHPLVALAISALAFSAMAVLVHVASGRGYGTLELVVWRMGLGALAVAPMVRRSGETFVVARKGLMLIRALVGASSIVTFFWSLSLLPVGLASLFNYLGPLFTTLFAALFLAERPRPVLLAGLVVAFAGATMTVGFSRAGATISVLGMLVGIFSAVAQGAAVTMIRQLRRTEGSTTIFFWFSVVTTACCLPFALPQLHVPTLPDLPLLLGIGLSSLLAQLLFTAALGHVPAASYTLMSPLTPVCSFLAGAVLLGEPVTLRVAFGAALAVSGVALGSAFGTQGGPGGPPPDKGEAVVSETVAG